MNVSVKQDTDWEAGVEPPAYNDKDNKKCTLDGSARVAPRDRLASDAPRDR